MAKRQPHSDKERFWRRQIQRWDRSPLSIRSFCQIHQLHESSFHHWRRELKRRDEARQQTHAAPPTSPTLCPTFLQLRVEPTPDAELQPLEVVLANGRLVRVRPGFDAATLTRLLALVQQHLGADPLSGDLFVFRSKRGDRLKLLYWDEDGLAIWYKRLEIGTFLFPPAGPGREPVGTQGLALRPAELAMLLDGIDLSSVKRQKRYQRTLPSAAPEVPKPIP